MWWTDFWYSIGNFFGIVNESGPGYGFFSGVGSDLGELPLLVAFVAVYRHHECHVDGCHRIGRMKHTQDGQEYTLCRKHHPTGGSISAEDLKAADGH